jgi:hypothetical protein
MTSLSLMRRPRCGNKDLDGGGGGGVEEHRRKRRFDVFYDRMRESDGRVYG